MPQHIQIHLTQDADGCCAQAWAGDEQLSHVTRADNSGQAVDRALMQAHTVMISPSVRLRRALRRQGAPRPRA